MIENPCRGCDNRKAGCHGSCNKYKLWRAIHFAELNKARRNVDKCNINNDQSINMIKRRKGV